MIFLIRRNPRNFLEIINNIKSEPEVLELLRLCIWINICRMGLGNSFNNKFNEVKEQLELRDRDKLVESFAKKCTPISKILLNNTIAQLKR